MAYKTDCVQSKRTYEPVRKTWKSERKRRHSIARTERVKKGTNSSTEKGKTKLLAHHRDVKRGCNLLVAPVTSLTKGAS